MPRANPGNRRRTLASLGRGPIVVRAAGRDDLDAIVRLRMAAVREEKHPTASGASSGGPDAPDDVTRARHLTRRQLTGKHEAFFLAIRAGNPVGVVRVREVRRVSPIRDQSQALLTTAFVVARERRTGVMRALVEAADEWARSRGLGAIRLRCATDNTVGRRTWAALGFESVALLMERSIPHP